MTAEDTRPASTVVSFPAAEVVGSGVVRRAEHGEDGRVLLVADRTPFHPVDHTWPDQPADRGSATVAGIGYTVEDAVTGAVGPDAQTMYLGSAIPVRRGDADWAFLVVHVLPADAELPQVGAAVEFSVDADYRAELSAGHSACHLASLALNESLAALWTKIPRTDCLGHPDFDQSAIAQSRILPSGAVDEYRLGKSLRKSGFGTDALAGQLGQVQAAVNDRLEGWIKAAGRAWIERDGPELTARRWWNCELPEGTARIACGGTHVAATDVLGAVEVELELEDANKANKLVMRTTVRR